MKYCSGCNTTRTLDYFYPKTLSSGKPGYRAYCKICGKNQRDTWRKSSSKDNDRNKAYNKEHADEIRGKKLVKNYWPHLTWQQALAEWDRLYTEQNGLCAFGHKTDKLHVDHHHTLGNVRGLLCYNCNNGLGRFKEDISVLLKAIDYLKKHNPS